RIVADDSLPFLEHLLADHVHLRRVPADQLNSSTLAGADGLIVRTVTAVTEALVAGSPVRWVGTASSGTDHLDLPYLRSRGIEVASSLGANALSVVQYVLTQIGAWAQMHERELAQVSLGLIGCGHVGTMLKETATELGMRVEAYDPWQQSCKDTVLEQVCTCDVISLHASVIKNQRGQYPGPASAFHLLDDQCLPLLKSSQLLLNTARGDMLAPGVIGNLHRHCPQLQLALDVWHDEPCIDAAEIAQCWRVSPHIAGLSLPARAASIRKVAQKAREFFQLGAEAIAVGAQSQSAQPTILAAEAVAQAEGQIARFGLPVALMHRSVPVVEADQQMRQTIKRAEPADNPAVFRQLRAQFSDWPGLGCLQAQWTPRAQQVLQAIGYQLID
ncbi:MAG: NAD(P)-dependent oxidoreductase, partial [Gammaproteobacteria bacterium]